MSVRLALALVLLVAGCGSSTKSAQGSPRLESCVERFVDQAGEDSITIRRYVEQTYCRPFEKRGWVHADGTLSIDAQLWLEKGGTCAIATAGEPARTVPCEKLEQGRGLQTIDCAMLHLVRKSEAQKYVAELQRTRKIACDDGTPLDELGAS